ncbi:MAG: ABC transporter permease subunit [Bdellovibrionota bacterium]
MKFLKSLLLFCAAVFLSYLFVRCLLWQLPGTLADVLSDSETNLKDLELLRQEFQVSESFWKPLWNFLTLNWGVSQLFREENFPLIMNHFYLTLRLSLLSLLLTFVFSGCFFLFNQKFSERLSNLLLALPAIAIYPLVVFFLCDWTSYCPAGSSALFKAIFLAALAQGLLASPRFYRELEWELDEIRRQRFVLVLRAKGVRPSKIWSVHILKNAIAPFLSLMLLTILSFFAGAVLLEALFDLPGMGLLLLEAIRARDFTLIFPLVMFLSLLHLSTLQAGRFLKIGRAHAL